MAKSRVASLAPEISEPGALPSLCKTDSPTQIADERFSKLAESIAALNEKIEQGRNDSDEETIHKLRTGTRRASALLASILEDIGHAQARKPLRNRMEKLLRSWKAVRRASGGVRDLDVHRILLLKFVEKPPNGKIAPANDTADTGPIPAPAPTSALTPAQTLCQQAQKLEQWLARERVRRVEDLQQELEKRHAIAKTLAHEVLRDLEEVRSRSKRKDRSAAQLALARFVAVAAEMPVLGKENLHDFRKETKEARYLAEAGAEDKQAVAVAKALKQVQDAVGDWHDWETLALEADRALGAGGHDLRDHLEEKAAALYHEALTVCERLRGRLLGEQLAMAQNNKRRRVRGAGKKSLAASGASADRKPGSRSHTA